MMTIEQAEKLMCEFIAARTEYQKTEGKTEEIELKRLERECIEKFKYIVVGRTNRYKGFNNHEDLIQEGLFALNQAMATYNPGKGIFFYWAHKYIDTRIARRASLHSAIRFPLKYARSTPPRREGALPRLLDEGPGPEDTLEGKELLTCVERSFRKLPGSQKKVAALYFGIGNKACSISKVSKKLKISQPMVQSILDQAILSLQRSIKL